VSKLDDFFNPINLFCAVGITTKDIFWRQLWRYFYAKICAQKITPKIDFIMPKFVRRKLRQKWTLLCQN
jgi:hypothetical protein